MVIQLNEKSRDVGLKKSLSKTKVMIRTRLWWNVISKIKAAAISAAALAELMKKFPLKIKKKKSKILKKKIKVYIYGDETDF